MATTIRDRLFLASSLENNLPQWLAASTAELVMLLQKSWPAMDLSHLSKNEIICYLVNNHVNQMI